MPLFPFNQLQSLSNWAFACWLYSNSFQLSSPSLSSGGSFFPSFCLACLVVPVLTGCPVLYSGLRSQWCLCNWWVIEQWSACPKELILLVMQKTKKEKQKSNKGGGGRLCDVRSLLDKHFHTLTIHTFLSDPLPQLNIEYVWGIVHQESVWWDWKQIENCPAGKSSQMKEIKAGMPPSCLSSWNELGRRSSRDRKNLAEQEENYSYEKHNKLFQAPDSFIPQLKSKNDCLLNVSDKVECRHITLPGELPYLTIVPLYP